jgi:hypothetical protein
MSLDCSCNATLQNTGTPNCPTLRSIARHMMLVAEIADDGTVNSLGQSAYSVAGLAAKLDNTNKTKRFYPILNLENVSDERAETMFQEFNSGRRAKVRKGYRTFVGYSLIADPILLGKIQSFGCSNLGAYFMDEALNLYYNKNEGSSDLFPFLIDRETFDVQLIFGKDDEVPMIMITFQYSQSMQDKNIRKMPPSVGLDESDIYGLLDVEVVASTVTTTTIQMQLNDAYGNPVVGLVQGDFTLAEVSPTPGAVTITGFAAVQNTYTLTFSTQTQNDVLQATITKARFDFTDANAELYTIP